MNPVAALISRGKTCAPPAPELAAIGSAVIAEASSRAAGIDSVEKLDTPLHSEIKGWFSNRTLIDLTCLRNSIEVTPEPARTTLLVAFSAILRAVCSQDKHWGWICDNVKPSELHDREVFAAFKARVDLIVEGLRMVRDELTRLGVRRVPTVKVVEGTAQTALKAMRPSSVDLVVTSPPYFGMTDYVRSQRLTNYWLGVDTDRVKVDETGARYKRKRTKVDPLIEFLEEMAEALSQTKRVLRSDRHCCLVVGESPVRAPYLSQLIEVAESLGFECEERLSRKVPRQRSLSPSMTEESIVVLRKKPK